MTRRPFRHAAVLAAALAAAACSPTYTPACLGDAEHPLEPGHLAQPSGMALHGGSLYVANAAGSAPADGDFDYCGSFISVLDPATGAPQRGPILPIDAALDEEQQRYRFFSAITYDAKRDVLYVAERQRGGVLKIDPKSGAVLGRVAAGHGPFDLRFIYGVPTTWHGEAAKVRDLLFVADLGYGANPGHLYVIDADDFTFRGAREIFLGRVGRPNALSYDPLTYTLHVSLYEATGIAGVDVRSVTLSYLSETPLAGFPLYTRGTAAVTGATEIFYTAEAPAYGGIWQTDAKGQLEDVLRLPVPATYLAVYGERLLALARNRLYVIERAPLRLSETLIIGSPSPARLLIDSAAKRAYISATRPSAVLIQELP